MKNKNVTGLIGLLISLMAINVTAQKLPGVQKNSLFAPPNINIDGNAIEWGDAYQAFNKATGVSYSIANDRDNIYLIIHSKQSRVIEKMLEGGISFVVNDINNTAKKPTVLFPLLTMPVSWSVLHNAGKTLTEKLSDRDVEIPDPYGVGKNRDSMLNLKPIIAIETANVLLHTNLKEIKVSGIEAITDTITGINKKSTYFRGLPLHAHHFELIPVNNRDNIKAMVQFDHEGNLTYELALPLKYITSAINEARTISYQIILNARSDDQRFGSWISYKRVNDQMVLQNMDLEVPTSLKGKYTLATP